ncbi:HepT-like ribonuclease domain-containing protein [Parapedobacter sp. 10938]|uniref:HepT-like ribonuclease domain-containing protein n=1 Tax=Parapedobacter flavus TaxID=3110225 RepID=UPI002DB67564|nr:DUF86 domain-containing protein [Parapedobacter sp. 10938]MEC3879123.1 DUF86 domain-containing protein [Parapedobacter sp. 10938]
MEKSSSVYLHHILDCISRIHAYTKDVDEQAFLKDFLIQDAVIRNFEVIGEAVKKVDSVIRKKYPEIPWKNIAGMRDKLIHDYMGVDVRAVWGVVEDILPEFGQQVKHIIDHLEK